MRKILLVDDNDTLRQVVRAYLEKKGFQVIEATEGWECVSSVSRHSPDLILLDVDMPKMGGIATLELLSSSDLIKHCPIIMLSGQHDKEVVVQAIQLGAVDYIVKPFEMKDLVARIVKHLKASTEQRFAGNE